MDNPLIMAEARKGGTHQCNAGAIGYRRCQWPGVKTLNL